jgi:retron-type reverse transcriptase
MPPAEQCWPSSGHDTGYQIRSKARLQQNRIKSRSVNWIADADIRSFFDEIDHVWMLRFLEHRIADQRILRLIRKWLEAGVIEDGKRIPAVEGTPQGAVI